MTTTFTENDTCAEHDETAQLAPRPYWQDRPCPPWCGISGDHSDTDDHAERVHQALAAPLTLTLEGPVVVLVQGQDEGSRGLIAEPSGLEVFILQGYRESEPYLKVNMQLPPGAVPGARLTLAEASQLAEILTNAVRQARDPLAC
jgi:hypothetical protein